MNIYAKVEDGSPVIILEAHQSDSAVNISGNYTISVKLSVMDICEIQEAMDSVLYEPGNRSLYTYSLKDFVPLLCKEEAHELFFSIPYEDGLDLTKALAVRIAIELDKAHSKNKPPTYGEVIYFVSKVMSPEARRTATYLARRHILSPK